MSDTNLPISGYVLAGGRSSRMGTDKALLQLAGKPLIAHAVNKLHHLCAEVRILSSYPALTPYSPLVSDLHPGCGPIGGIEAALAHAAHDWSLILPVDMPLLPASYLRTWVAGNDILDPSTTARIAIHTVNGRTQPALCLLHKEVAPYIAAAVERGEFKLLPALEAAANALAVKRGQPVHGVLSNRQIDPVQDAAMHLWFTNLNTPKDFALAEANAEALDA